MVDFLYAKWNWLCNKCNCLCNETHKKKGDGNNLWIALDAQYSFQNSTSADCAQCAILFKLHRCKVARHVKTTLFLCSNVQLLALCYVKNVGVLYFSVSSESNRDAQQKDSTHFGYCVKDPYFLSCIVSRPLRASFVSCTNIAFPNSFSSDCARCAILPKPG